MSRLIYVFGFLVSLTIAAPIQAAWALSASLRAGEKDELSSLSGSYLVGLSAIRANDIEVAARFMNNAVNDDPDNVMLLDRALIADVSAGNIGRAGNLAWCLAALDERHPLANIVLGLEAFGNGRREAALEYFDLASSTAIGRLTGGLLSAWAYAAMQDSAQAFATLDRLGDNEIFNPYKTFYSAVIADVLRLDAKATSLYEQSLSQSGKSPRVVLAYGDFLRRIGRNEQAEQVYRTYLADEPGDPLVGEALLNLRNGNESGDFIGNARDGMAEAMFDLAGELNNALNHEMALAYARFALDIDPGLVAARLLLGDILSDMKRYEEANEIYGQIPASSPLYHDAQIRVALDLDTLGRIDDAAALLQHLSKSFAGDYGIFITLGDILRADSRFREAAESYSRAIALMGAPKTRQWALFYFRGISYERGGQWQKAEADFLRALELKPDQPRVLNYLAYSWLVQGHNLNKALDMIETAVRRRPDDGYIVDSLGWGYYCLGEYGTAVETLEHAVELTPADPVVNDHLGDAYWKVGRKREAVFQWSHARSDDPEPDLLERLDRKLEKGMTGSREGDSTSVARKSA